MIMKRLSAALLLSTLAACASRPLDEVRAEEASSWRDRGDAAYEAGDFVSAIECYTESLKLNPTSGETYYKRGNANIKRPTDPDSPNHRRDWVRFAHDDYSAAIRCNPALTSAYFNRAMVRMKLKRYVEAAQDLFDVVSRLQGTTDPMLVESELILGDIYLKKLEDQLVTGMKHYDEYVRLGGDRPDVVKLVREWRELQGSLAGDKGAPAPKGPSPEDEAAAKQLHARILSLIPKGEEQKPEIAKLLEELTTKYAQTKYVRDNEKGLKALLNAFRPKEQK